MPDSVTGTRATARHTLDSGRGAVFGIDGGLVAVLRPCGDRPVGFQPQIEHVEPIGLEFLALVVDGGGNDILRIVNGNLERWRGGCVHGVMALIGVTLVPALRSVGDPVDGRVTVDDGQGGSRHRVIVRDDHAGTIGHPGARNHDPPVDDAQVIGREPPGLVDLGGNLGAVADIPLPIGQRNIEWAAAEGESHLVGVDQGAHLRAHPQRATDIVLALDVLVEGADHFGFPHLAGAVGQRITLGPLELETSSGTSDFFGQVEPEGVPRFAALIGNPPLCVDPHTAPQVDRGIAGIKFRQPDASPVDGIHLGGPRHGARSNQTGDADQESKQKHPQPPPAASFGPLQHVVPLSCQYMYFLSSDRLTFGG